VVNNHKQKEACMKRFIAVLCILAIGVPAFPAASQAQQENKPMRYENVAWKTITYVKFVAGKRNKALGIIRDHFMKAGQTAGTPGPTMYEMRSGKWDLVLVWDMKEGVESLTWERSPDGVAWFKALSEQEGGADKAQALYDEYNSLVAEGHSELAMLRK
jgi:hypothetical protein